VHESTANTLLASLTTSSQLMLKNKTLSDALLTAFPEIATHYGADAVCEVALVP